jgi:glutathione synthase/RimK-type ligase-like ATP-grasp enzyme
MPSTRPAVALVTCAEFPRLVPDDLPLAAALERRGLRPVPALWDDPAQRWGDYAAVVLRSCWDYHHRAGEFARWLERLEREGARVRNPLATLRWNFRKTYLRDLAAAGVPVTGTVWAEMGSATTLRDIARSTGWTVMVVKPTVSASGWETWLVERAGVPEDEARFADHLRSRDLMIQPFMPGVLTEGEVSMIFLDGQYSHAVRKRPRPGEFRVQEEHGGSVEREEAPAALVGQAAAALAVAPRGSLYARVDGLVENGKLTVSELEMIEPKLYFTWHEAAAETMAAAVEKGLGARG